MNFATYHKVDTSDMAADDGTSVGGCCLPVQYAEPEPSEDPEVDVWAPITFRQWTTLFFLGSAALAADLFIIIKLGGF